MKLDLNLLKRLLVIDHSSKQEWPMITAIINECYRIGNLEFEMDAYANIFITKNTTNPEYYPCVVAHMDCVIPCANKEVKIKDNRITGRNIVTGKRVGLGADDSVGICIAIQLLKSIPDLKVCFTTEEEIGFKGADAAADNLDFFYNVSYLIQADRHGKSDLITYTNFIYSASQDWLQEATGVMAKYRYTEESGIGTDIGVLAERLQLSGVNVSCGYYKEHTDKEYIIIPETQNCLNFINEIINTVPCDRQYEIKIDYYAYNRYNPYANWNFENDDPVKVYPSENDYIYGNHCYDCKDFDCMHCPYYD